MTRDYSYRSPGTTCPPFPVATVAGRDRYFMVRGELHGPIADEITARLEYDVRVRVGTVQESV